MNRFIPVALVTIFLSFSAKAAGLIEESVKLPATFSGFFGSYTVDLDALIIRLDDDQRHPLVVINHGTPRATEATLQQMSPEGMRAQLREFARRGWVSVAFMRRGYGASEGRYAESGGACDTADYESVGRASATDVREVIRLMREKPYVDGSKVISVGISSGGFATVALTADPPPGLVAAINFAGGRGSPRPDQVCNVPGLVNAFASFGHTSRTPMLWVYAENDHFFGPVLAMQFYQAFTTAGGQAEFIAAASFGEDGHHLFSMGGVPIWTQYADAFLAEQNLTLRESPLPRDDGVVFPDGLGERGKKAFLDYFESRGHKAFALSANGHVGWRIRRDSVADAVEQALANCTKAAGHPCRIVNIDNGNATTKE